MHFQLQLQKVRVKLLTSSKLTNNVTVHAKCHFVLVVDWWKLKFSDLGGQKIAQCLAVGVVCKVLTYSRTKKEPLIALGSSVAWDRVGDSRCSVTV